MRGQSGTGAEVIVDPSEVEIASRRRIVPVSLHRLVERVKSLDAPPAVAAVHGATLTAALVFWLIVDRHLWFFGDEWDFITRRGLWHAKVSIWVPHNEHWSTLPILLWRGLFSLVHLHHYWPYLLPMLLCHLAVVYLVWRRCLREGVDPWVATAVAAVLAFLGAGAEDLTWAFQVGFLGSLAFGLLALDLVDGQETSAGRDVAASLAAVAALMCSAIGVATLTGLAVVLVCQRRWRRAAGILALPVAAFILWFELIGKRGISATGDSINHSILSATPAWIWTEVTTDLGRMFDFNQPGLQQDGPILTLCFIAWLLWQTRRLARRHPAVLGLAISALVFYCLSALGRARLGEDSTPSRYIYVVAALLLPAFAMAIGLGRPVIARWRPLVLSVVALIAVGNIFQALNFAQSRTGYVLGLKQQIEGSGELLLAGQRYINDSPIPASGNNAGYLTPAVLVQLELRGLLPWLNLTTVDRFTDQTALDVIFGRRPFVRGHFHEVDTSTAWLQAAGRGCVTVNPTFRGVPGQITLALAAHSRSASVRVSNLHDQKLTVFLSPELIPLVGESGEILNAGVAGRGYVSDDIGGSYLVVRTPPNQPTMVCGLATRGPRSRTSRRIPAPVRGTSLGP